MPRSLHNKQLQTQTIHGLKKKNKYFFNDPIKPTIYKSVVGLHHKFATYSIITSHMQSRLDSHTINCCHLRQIWRVTDLYIFLIWSVIRVTRGKRIGEKAARRKL